MTRALFCFLLIFGVSLADDSKKPLVFESLTGEKIEPLVSEKGKPTAVIFITTDCPIANGYSPELGRIFKKYSELGVKLTLVHVDPDLTKADAKKHADDYSLPAPIIIDREQKLVAATKATITPEAAVFDGDGKLIYLGRIDNRYAALGDRRNTVTDHNLRDALDAALAGQPLKKAKVKAIGCFIPEL